MVFTPDIVPPTFSSQDHHGPRRLPPEPLQPELLPPGKAVEDAWMVKGGVEDVFLMRLKHAVYIDINIYIHIKMHAYRKCVNGFI